MTRIGFATEEIDLAAPTRAARLKWVIVVDEALSPGIAANAVACTAAATSAGVDGLLGPSGDDGAGSRHPGLPWAGCSVLRAPAGRLAEIRAKASASEEVFVADMPSAAQLTRVYSEFLSTLASQQPDELSYYAVSLVGPRNRVDKIVGRLALL